MWDDLISLIFPPRCVGCGGRGAWFCARCAKAVVASQQAGSRCARCDRPLAGGGCVACQSMAMELDGVRVAGAYTPPLKTAILAFKYQRRSGAARDLGQILAHAWQARPGAPIERIVAIPMPAERRRQRGFNQADLLARVCARELHVTYFPQALRPTRTPQQQHTLSAAARRANVLGLYACDGPGASDLAGRNVLIVDDITTTGATLEAAASTLRAAGVRSAWGLALARPELIP